MKIQFQKHNRGIAMIIVMVVIVVLGILAGGFAYSMRVEMRLAQQANYDSDFEWLGRSGVELARCVLVEEFKNRSVAGTAVDCLNQKWAGGSGGSSTNVLPDIFLEHVELGKGVVSIKIVDAERKININRIGTPPLLALTQRLLNQSMIYLGVDPTEASTIVDSILDWVDQDNDPRISGTESSYYLQQDPPYSAKNGPMDDITELLLVRGIRDNPAIFWGSNSTNYNPGAFMNKDSWKRNQEVIDYPFGLNDLFTTISSGRVNVNTAPQHVLEVILQDPNLASMIITHRNGPDGQEGTDDDMPFKTPAEIGGILSGAVPAEFLNTVFAVNSQVFEVQVTCNIGGFTREYVALVNRLNQRDVNILTMYWKRGANASSGSNLDH
ncbi:MAG: general secretion pathway protein GspK [Limisphaerales bacterium]